MDSSQASRQAEPSRNRSRDSTFTLYRFFAVDGTLLYIGVTGTPRARWSHHSKTKDEWRRVDTIKVEHLDSREELEAAEKAAIKAERPLWNLIHNKPTRTVAEVRTLLDQGSWLSVDEVAVLFGASKSVASAWVTRGTALLGGTRPERRESAGRVEVEPGWVASLLLECRKVRSPDYPDGEPGVLANLRHW
ncbi:GIY-YIG nuclease family protein [Salinispora arenicola]|uniref:GIY-YIG nuclease family protein n=1 Tax=Salinispora arenicola TaxID=168697 RepID=UPI0016A1A572|nr:GIY-YIG nuclease family protein [Salinispora arenicola]NIL57102.1 GIY-YIG nuclease family protein [Salinispora arenicola]NIL62676.1 GIY-YIG nuclease family protein [Salinispora arenicola]